MACVYGDLTTRLAEVVAAGGGTLDVVDVLPVQLQNLRRKLQPESPARLWTMNSAQLQFADSSYDRALLFFLLHEQPLDVRRRTLHEVFRVVKPGGKIVVVDYARPRWWHPLRYPLRLVHMTLEPFALDLWHDDIVAWTPTAAVAQIQRQLFFGGMFQMLTFTRGPLS